MTKTGQRMEVLGYLCFVFSSSASGSRDCETDGIGLEEVQGASSGCAFQVDPFLCFDDDEREHLLVTWEILCLGTEEWKILCFVGGESDALCFGS